MNELDELISTLQRKGVKTIFYATPLFKEYTSFLDTTIIQENNKIAKILCEKYNMEYWNYAIQHDFTKSEFYNPDHLNKEGAKRFAKILNSRLLKK